MKLSKALRDDIEYPWDKTRSKLQEWWYESFQRRFFWPYIEFPVSDFIKGVKNIIRWVPVLWKDRDWDTHYTLTILVTKLKFQREHLDKRSNEVRESLDVHLQNMDTIIDLITKVADEDTYYSEPAYRQHEAKWGASDIYFVECESDPDMFEMKNRRKDKLTPEELEQESKDFMDATTAAGAQCQADFKKAMDIFVNESAAWWE